MSYETTNIYVLDQNEDPIENVVVRFYQSGSYALATMGTTDSNGLVSVLLPSGTLTVRCFKFAYTFGAPTEIEVLEGQNNAFNVYGQGVTSSDATDSRLCNVGGFFRTESGAPAAHVDIHFVARFDPLFLDGAAVMPKRLSVRTDESGYAQTTLIRNGEYDVLVQGDIDLMRKITVPDLAATSLPDMLFPVVSRVVFDVSTPWAIPIGSSLEVIPTVYLSDGRVLEGTAQDDVTWATSDDAVMGLEVSSDKLTLQGLSAGIAELSVARSDYTIIRIPDLDITGQPVTATVS